MQRDVILTLHVLLDSKTSPTQPGRGIRKIVDLYHDLTELLSKARKQSTLEDMDQDDFIGMTEDEIEEERKEYALPSQPTRMICDSCDLLLFFQPQTVPHRHETPQYTRTRF
jgi:hypothetical protein